MNQNINDFNNMNAFNQNMNNFGNVNDNMFDQNINTDVNGFNIPNQNPVQPNNDNFNIFNNVSNVPQTEGQAVSSGIIPVQPIPSNVAENVNTSFSNIAGESSNFSEPNISNSVTNDSNIAPTINQNSTEASSSTFDIGLNSSNDVNAEQSLNI